jgi:hypothetical protein
VTFLGKFILIYRIVTSYVYGGRCHIDQADQEEVFFF